MIGKAAVFLSITLSIVGIIQRESATVPSVIQRVPSAQTASVDESLNIASSSVPDAVNTAPEPTSSIITLNDKSVQAPTKTRSINRVPTHPLSTGTTTVVRIQHPYTFPPESFDAVNTAARNALVNILCMSRSGGSLQPISGSGVVIDPRGIILTNAHVAQYVLLSQNPNIDLSCEVRAGAPARAEWTPNILYIPPVWVQAHASDINAVHPRGTGEHDYALLLITGTVSGTLSPSTFPFLPFDSRDAIGFPGDTILGFSYPAEFLGGIGAENTLFPVSSAAPLNKLLTFATSTVDAFSLGGVIEAQSGSSGGGVANAWGQLIALISTTSDAPTTAGRDLRAITMSYINRDLAAQTGSGLALFLAGDLTAKSKSFNTLVSPGLIQQYIEKLSH
jgi:hypothetical protein